jgi:2-dehydro-3-deoxyphosphogluconate aldolase / (4S)-4-hydroxy-2-oxoglutarate aldolase
VSAPSLPAPLTGQRIVPVVVIDDAALAVDVGAALARGGIGCAEITLRTPAAVDAIRAMSGAGDLVVGAGTVLTTDDVLRVADAGARFVVSPGLDDDVIACAFDRGLGVLPGAATATEVQRALRAGVRTVKFFPAHRLGGVDTIAALAAPFPTTGFVPSGGVTASTMAAYLAHPSVPAVSGSWMVAPRLLAGRDLDAIEALSRVAASVARTVGS